MPTLPNASGLSEMEADQRGTRAERAARQLYAERLVDALIKAAAHKQVADSEKCHPLAREGARIHYSIARHDAIKLLTDGEVVL